MAVLAAECHCFTVSYSLLRGALPYSAPVYAKPVVTVSDIWFASDRVTHPTLFQPCENRSSHAIIPLFNGPQGTNAVDYSHTSVFTASYNMLPPTLSNNVPPITTICTAPSSFTNRWMLNMTKTDTEAPFRIAFSHDLTLTLDDPLVGQKSSM